MAVAESAAALARVLADPTFELIPLKNVHEQAAAIPRGRTVSVTASPGKPIETTVELAVEQPGEVRAIADHASGEVRDRAQPGGLELDRQLHGRLDGLARRCRHRHGPPARDRGGLLVDVPEWDQLERRVGEHPRERGGASGDGHRRAA